MARHGLTISKSTGWLIEKQAICLIVLAFLVVAINHKSIHADRAKIISFFKK